ncbi:hypothetical protein F5Y16DRAFT_404060 [Xylariaceae sp. FL0255]|nr:hypothetical protein F5Y16DRAFT_404060 [Xylariaceae sp. FL0255]
MGSSAGDCDSKVVSGTPSDTIHVSPLPKAGRRSLPSTRSDRSGVRDEMNGATSPCESQPTTRGTNNRTNKRKQVPENQLAHLLDLTTSRPSEDRPDKDALKKQRNTEAAARMRKRKVEERENNIETIRLLEEENLNLKRRLKDHEYLKEENSNLKSRLQDQENLEEEKVSTGFAELREVLQNALGQNMRSFDNQRKKIQDQLEVHEVEEQARLAAEFSRKQMESKDRFNKEREVVRVKHAEDTKVLELQYAHNINELEKKEGEWMAIGTRRKALAKECLEWLNQATHSSSTTPSQALHHP